MDESLPWPTEIFRHNIYIYIKLKLLLRNKISDMRDSWQHIVGRVWPWAAN